MHAIFKDIKLKKKCILESMNYILTQLENNLNVQESAFK